MHNTFAMKVFGIRSIRINDTVIHTYNVMVKKSHANMTIIIDHGLKAVEAGRSNNRLKLTFTSLDIEEFSVETNKLGKVLKEIAQVNLDNKYHWVK
jgi:hypothetical protein